MLKFEENLYGDVARVVHRCGGAPISFVAKDLQAVLGTDIATIKAGVLKQLPQGFIAVDGLDTVTFGMKGKVKENSFQKTVNIDVPKK